jgi:oligopeptide/dipeptide ABC transporter ATP-binding protein
VTILIDVQNLKKYFPVEAGLFRTGGGFIKAVDDITFQIKKGTTMGLVGESGCGKTTVGKNVLILQKPTSGKIYFGGEDLLQLNKKQLRMIRNRQGIVYQNPHASLNPRMTVASSVGRPLAIHGTKDVTQRVDQVTVMLSKVGLNPEHLSRYPHEFSGGQKQRIAIARALITKPDFVVLDEPSSALDVSVQAQILKLLRTLQDELNLTYLFISHDISVIRYMSDIVGVMYVGKIVERASTISFFKQPLHPYTQALLSVVPIPDPKKRRRHRKILSGDVPSPKNPPPGCRFHPRCDRVFEECKIHEPMLTDIGNGHYVACHLYKMPD